HAISGCIPESDLGIGGAAAGSGCRARIYAGTASAATGGKKNSGNQHKGKSGLGDCLSKRFQVFSVHFSNLLRVGGTQLILVFVWKYCPWIQSASRRSSMETAVVPWSCRAKLVRRSRTSFTYLVLCC